MISSTSFPPPLFQKKGREVFFLTGLTYIGQIHRVKAVERMGFQRRTTLLSSNYLPR
jgi:hypothetical protein